MPNAILDGLAQVDAVGHAILFANLACLLLAIVANLVLRRRYTAMATEMRRNPAFDSALFDPVLSRIVRQAAEAMRRPADLNGQAIVEEGFHEEGRALLLAERFIRAATGLVIILGLLGTFYGLTLSIGKLVALVSSDGAGAGDVTQMVTTGLTRSLSGMAIAFSNSLLGIASAVILTVIGVFSNVTDRRTGVMVQIETCLDRMFAEASGRRGNGDAVPGTRIAAGNTERLNDIVTDFGESVVRLEGAVAQFDAALQAFAGSTREFQEFNLHLKDNVQRMSLSFGDFSETMKSQIIAMKSNPRG